MPAVAERLQSPATAVKVVPFWLPATHFAGALCFLVAAALHLPFVVSAIAAGEFLQPRVAAVVHLITLGWLTLSIMGALCQLFPVVLGVTLYSVRLAVVTLALFIPGLALFVRALSAGHLALAPVGAALFATALLLFLYNATRTLFRNRNRDLTWWTLLAAFSFLLATIAFGGALAINLRTGALIADRIQALAVHVHVAVAGWVALVVMAVGRRLLPMFLLSHGSGERWLRVAIGFTIAGAGVLTLSHHYMRPALFKFAVILLAAGALAFALQLRSYLRTRHRPQLDAGLRLVLVGALSVGAAVIMGLLLLAFGGSPRLITTYGVLLLGGFLLFVAGHYYKILPFLLWNHRYAPLAGKRALPKIADLLSARVAHVAVICAGAGVPLLASAVLLRLSALAQAASGLLIIGCAVEAGQLFWLLRSRVT